MLYSLCEIFNVKSIKRIFPIIVEISENAFYEIVYAILIYWISLRRYLLALWGKVEEENLTTQAKYFSQPTVILNFSGTFRQGKVLCRVGGLIISYRVVVII